MNEKRKRPNYTKEFKQDAVKLVIEQRYSCPEVGRRLGVAASNVTRWVRPSLRKSRVEIRLHPARKEGLSCHRSVQGDGSQPERILRLSW